jgi:Tfp pilus assembly PilM family ATPase
MFEFLNTLTCPKTALLQRFGSTKPLGVDIGYESVKVAQLAENGRGLSLVGCQSRQKPADIEGGSSTWQRWAIDALRELTREGRFRGREVVAALPANEVHIEHLKMSRAKELEQDAKKGCLCPDEKFQEAVFSRLKQKLTISPDKMIIKYVAGENDNVVVIVVEREKIDRHLAIYEKSELSIRSIAVWPTALISAYTGFFGRRKTDAAAVVMLLDIEPSMTKVVICRHRNLLFARSIPMGIRLGVSEEEMTRLVLELTACKRHFASTNKNGQIERLIFLSGEATEKEVCAKIARQLEMPAQMGDCVAAVDGSSAAGTEINKERLDVNWATAFGLSLTL